MAEMRSPKNDIAIIMVTTGPDSVRMIQTMDTTYEIAKTNGITWALRMYLFWTPAAQLHRKRSRSAHFESPELVVGMISTAGIGQYYFTPTPAQGRRHQHPYLDKNGTSYRLITEFRIMKSAGSTPPWRKRWNLASHATVKRTAGHGIDGLHKWQKKKYQMKSVNAAIVPAFDSTGNAIKIQGAPW